MDGVVWIGRTKVPFRCVASQRIKTARIEVAGSEVIITYPTAQSISHETAEALILAKKRWLIEKLSQAGHVQLKPSTTLPLLRSGMKVVHFGHERLVSVAAGERDHVEATSTKIMVSIAPCEVSSLAERAPKVLRAWQEEILKSVCEAIVREHEQFCDVVSLINSKKKDSVKVERRHGKVVLIVSWSLLENTESEIHQKVTAALNDAKMDKLPQQNGQIVTRSVPESKLA